MKRRVILTGFALVGFLVGGCASHKCSCTQQPPTKAKDSGGPVAVGSSGGATVTSTGTGGGATYHYPARKK